MKKHAFVMTMMIFACLSLKAQDDVIKINILSPVVKTLNLSYEHKISKDQSFQLGFYYTSYGSDGDSWKGYGITPEYRFYLSDTEAPAGVYIAPFVRYEHLTVKNDAGDNATLSGLGGGVVIGKQWVFKKHITLDTFIGPSYINASIKDNTGSGDYSTGSFDGFGLRAGLTFGFAF